MVIRTLILKIWCLPVQVFDEWWLDGGWLGRQLRSFQKMVRNELQRGTKVKKQFCAISAISSYVGADALFTFFKRIEA